MLRYGLTLLLATAFSVPVLGETRSASMVVTAQVVARAVVEIDAIPHVSVTSTDIARGFVDVAHPIRFRVRTNSRAGYLLQVAKTNDAFHSLELEFGNTSVNVMHEGWVTRPRVEGADVVTARLRVRLREGLSPGNYPMPLSISAQPL
jgi:hypothetical protein